VRSTNPLVATCLVAVGLLATSAHSAQAVRKPISGKLSKPGYTVIALAANGKATSVRARRGRFRLRPPAKRVTLHLRAADGTYAGPVVIGRRKNGKRTIVGVRAGATLGVVRVRRGYAKVSRTLRKKWIDSRRTARSKRGIPIGALVFGRVRSNPPRASIPGDLDADGIPQPLDIDDDGDLVLDNLDSSPAGRGARTAQTVGCGPGNIYCQDVSSGLRQFLEDTANANAGSTVDQIDEALRARGGLLFTVRGGGPVELDCAGDPLASPPRLGLSYCSTPGTGTAAVGGGAAGPPFPGPPGPLGMFDRDADGFGVLDPALEPNACGGGCPNGFFLAHGAGTAKFDSNGNRVPGGIGSGDQFLEHVATDGDSSRCPPPPAVTNDACVTSTTTLGYVFATVPALVRYSDTAGHSATVSYPVTGATPGCPPPACSPGEPGTPGNAFLAAAGLDGNIWLRLTFWRPQRTAIPRSDPPTATWMDVGHLSYGVGAHGPASFCRQSAFSEDDPNTPLVVEDDPNLTPATPHLFLQGGGGFDDGKDDAESSPGNTTPGRTFSYTLNLSRCLTDLGIAFPDELWLEFIGAPGAPNSASQIVAFRLPSGITVKKQTDPPESPTSGTEFQFHLVNATGGIDFRLRHDGTQSFDLQPGNYTVQEPDAIGYDLTGIACDDSDSTGSTADRQATFRVAAGEHVTCTFTNKKP
jgi:hypothetical protein